MKLYDGQEPAAVKSSWAHELAMFSGRLEAIAWALEMLPERCPNVLEFRKICRSAPAPDVPRLPDAKADPQRVSAELAKLGGVKAAVLGAANNSGKQWAKDLQGRIDRKEIVPTLFQRRCVRQAIVAAPSEESA
ncbi:MAG: hypothetical protein IV107_16555 [Paucibacter sp.]|nr:hypothetical protein [Roseateles sp.]